jgi:hypothetical protein
MYQCDIDTQIFPEKSNKVQNLFDEAIKASKKSLLDADEAMQLLSNCPTLSVDTTIGI